MDNLEVGAESTATSEVTSEVQSQTEVSQVQAGEATQSAAPDRTPAATGLAENLRTKAQQASTAKDATAQAPVYQPNFKYKVHDQEKEFDEFYRALVKDQDSEKRVREMHEKLFGFDVIKPKYEARTKELETLRQEYTPLKEGIQTLREHVGARDFDAFFQGLNIPKEWIIEWAAKTLSYENLSPEEKRRYDMEIETRRENSRLRKEAESYKSTAEQAKVQARQVELDTTLQSPEVNRVMQAFDQRAGKVGAFRDRVIREAQAIYFESGRDVSAKEAVESLMQVLGQVGPQSEPAQTVTQQTQPKPPVIPNIKSRGGSPVKKHPRSFEELRQLAAERRKELAG